MKALILINRIMQVSAQEFEVSAPLVWVDCPNDCTTEWTYDGGRFIEPVITTPTLAELKTLKNEEINAARLAANFTTFTRSGKLFACDQLSRGDIDGINGYVGTRGALPPNWLGGWKAVDNSILPIQDVAAWNAFYDSMISQGQANFTKSQLLKSQLAAAITAEQVAAINW